MARGKGKRGVGRGEGRRFAAESAAEIEQRNSRLANLDEARRRRREEEEEEGEGGGGDDDDGDDIKDEAEKVGSRIASMDVGDGGGEEGGGGGETRKQREERMKREAQERYRKLHEAGLTEEYKRDMAKLAEVRARREVAQARAKEEQEAAEQMAAEQRKKAAAAGAISLDDKNSNNNNNNEDKDSKKKKKKSKEDVSIPKLDKIAIKKMKPAQLKEALKERGLPIQGNSKDLTSRLLKYEESR
mmetsp:Transcript_16161/g.24622  ORF Transcript_16161/g.24622 Transcript_16161/m.24622 type:complete len:244 (-) Transcript_16161:155-886(-)